ncbi:MAG TPA: hypothetical protein PK988_08190, partial [Candidatus Sumerlaeota bacterium]|nr:hypothetical protein [Candidatus Sumerlaeota bacterium]
LMKLRSGDAMTPGAGRSAFVVVFALSLALALLSQILLSRVPEMKAIRTHKLLMQVIYDWPIKVLSGMNSNTRK